MSPYPSGINLSPSALNTPCLWCRGSDPHSGTAWTMFTRFCSYAWPGRRIVIDGNPTLPRGKKKRSKQAACLRLLDDEGWSVAQSMSNETGDILGTFHHVLTRLPSAFCACSIFLVFTHLHGHTRIRPPPPLPPPSFLLFLSFGCTPCSPFPQTRRVLACSRP